MDERILAAIGAALAAMSAAYIAQASVPTTAVPAMLFPLSILGLLFGTGCIVWSAGRYVWKHYTS